MQDLVQAEVPGGFIAVRHIKHGQKISEPGVYDMPMGWYHDDCCVGPSISSSGLRTIWQKSPLHYWYDSYMNPDRDEEDDEKVEAEALRMGRAAHALLLEPHLFGQMFTTRPPIFADWRTQKARQWRAEQQLEGKTVLDPAEFQRVHLIAKALKSHELYQQGILEGDIERSIVWQDKKTGVWLKARPDAIPSGSNIFADLKTVRDGRAQQLARHVFQYGYDMQMALGGVGMWEVLRRKVEEFVLVAVESKKPFAVRIAPIAHEEIVPALLMLRWSINKFAECLRTGEWPSFSEDDNSYIRRSEFERKRIEALLETKDFPKEF